MEWKKLDPVKTAVAKAMAVPLYNVLAGGAIIVNIVSRPNLNQRIHPKLHLVHSQYSMSDHRRHKTHNASQNHSNEPKSVYHQSGLHIFHQGLWVCASGRRNKCYFHFLP